MNNNKNNGEIPVGVKAISIWYYIQAFLITFLGTYFIIKDMIKDLEFTNATGHIAGGFGMSNFERVILLIIIVGFILLIANGIWKLKSWTRITVIILSSIIVFGSVWTLLFARFESKIMPTVFHTLFIITNLLIIIYLSFNKEVNKIFNK